MFCDAGKHAGTYLFTIMEREREIAVTGFPKNPMRSSLPLYPPAKVEQGVKDRPCFNGPPLHVLTNGKQS